MKIVRKQAHARAALVGNPSDGYGGKTLSVLVQNFAATVTLYEWDEIELLLSQQDKSRFDSVDELVRDVELHGYYGGVRLVKATIKKFVEYCRRKDHKLSETNFSIRYETNIPRQVGLAGSSAIVVATLRALCEFYNVDIPRVVLPSLALSVETTELGIGAGLQDRVIQVYGGLVYMDFSESRRGTQDGYSHGYYEPLQRTNMPPLYLAYGTTVSKLSGAIHTPLRQRFDAKEPAVLAGVQQLAQLADEARAAIGRKDWVCLGRLIDATFDARMSMYSPDAKLVDMIKRARQTGASANFAGSGGAIVGIYENDSMLEQLRRELRNIDCMVMKLNIADNPSFA